MFLPIGVPAPQFEFSAEVSRRRVGLESSTGVILLVFHSYQTAAAAEDVIRQVKNVYQKPEQVLVVGVADMRSVPRLLRGAARRMVKNAYDEAKRQIPAGEDPADHIIILADWEGILYEAYKVPQTNSNVALVVVDAAKRVTGTYFGGQPSSAAEDLVAAALNGSMKSVT